MLAKVLSHKTLREGVLVPWGYGFAWDLPDTRESVFFLIPLNFLFALLRQWYFRLMDGPRNKLEESIQEEWESKYGDAWGVGYRDGRKYAEEHTDFKRLEAIAKELGLIP